MFYDKDIGSNSTFTTDSTFEWFLKVSLFWFNVDIKTSPM